MVYSSPVAGHAWDRRLGVWWIAEDHPDQPAVVASPSGIELTFGELAARSHQLVHALRARGLRTGDIVAYALPNDVDILWWQFALQEAGMHAVALNPQLSGPEIRTILDHSGAAAVVVHHQFADTGDLAAAPSIRLRVSVAGAIPGFDTYADLVADQPTTRPPDRSFGTPISYSSGTTGQPKAIARGSVPGDPSAIADQMKLFCRAFQFHPLEGVHLASAGMHHGGCQAFYQGALNAGQALAIMAKFDAELTLQLIERHRVTTAYMVPTQFVRLLRLPPEVRARYDVSSLEVVVHSAAPCPIDVKQQMMDWWGPVIWETYGGMEGAAAIAKPHRWLERPGTVGRAVRGMTIKILDDDGRELPAGETGNVYLESDVPTFEYRNDPELTESVHRGRAFTLGDVGYLDDDGYLFLRDRAKDMIISGGVNIYPAEVEAVLTAHPAVHDVAVIGVPDAEWGESVKAVVEPVDGILGSAELERELVDFCRAKLASYKCPRSVDFRDELPRTETGKLFKRLLRDDYWREKAAGERNG
jgi:long-chain acyl-CoA synthetase